VLGICDFRHKTPRQSQISLTPAMRDKHGPKDQVFQNINKYYSIAFAILPSIAGGLALEL
jgi:hypothetical protein